MSANSPSWPKPSKTGNTSSDSTQSERDAAQRLTLLLMLLQGNGCFLLPTTTSFCLVVCKRTYG